MPQVIENNTGKKLFIGYDHGDAETLISYINPKFLNSVSGMYTTALPQDLCMPSHNTPGIAEPSVFGVMKDDSVILGSAILDADPDEVKKVYVSFKKQPTSFFKSASNSELEQIRIAFEAPGKAWPKLELANNKELIEMRDAFVLYINALFTCNKIAEKLSEFTECTELVVIIGHPTKWTPLDVSIYKRIFESSVLGKEVYDAGKRKFKLTLLMEAESRAGFLYARQAYIANAKQWNLDDYVLLIDVGSSTVDITGLSGRSCNSEYNHGHTSLGAQHIDKLIFNALLEKWKALNCLRHYETLKRLNPFIEQTYMFAARRAKEEFFSQNHNKKFYIDLHLPNIFPVSFTREEMNAIIDSPISEFVSRSWAMELDRFIKSEKDELQKQKITVKRVILTGSAAQMPFVKQICIKNFPGADVTLDLQTAQAIAKGLALVGQSSESSLKFQKEADSFLKYRVPEIVKSKLPNLAEKLSRIITVILLYDVTLSEMLKWKNSDHRTLHDAMDAVQSFSKEGKLQKKLEKNAAYNSALQHWVANDVIAQVEKEISDICKRYNTTSFIANTKTSHVSIDNINVPTSPDKDVAKKMLFPIDLISGIVGTIVGVVLTPVIYLVVCFIVSVISTILAVDIVAILVSNPIGVPIALAMVGVTLLGAAVAGKSVAEVINEKKQEMAEKVIDWNLPSIARGLVSENAIKKSIARSEQKTVAEIKKGLLSDKAESELSEGVTAGLRHPLLQKLAQIRYQIELINE